MSAAITNPYVSCPYNKAHSVPKLRLQRHLIKCRANNPDLARLLKPCPFNATHIMPEAELTTHFSLCPDRNLAEGLKYFYTPIHGDLGNPEFHLDVPVGDWDESDDEDPIERIYGRRNNDNVIFPVKDEFLPGGALGIHITPSNPPEPKEVEQPIMPRFSGMGRGRPHARLSNTDSSD